MPEELFRRRGPKKGRKVFKYGQKAPTTGRDVKLEESLIQAAAETALQGGLQFGLQAYRGHQQEEAAEARYRQESLMTGERQAAATERQRMQSSADLQKQEMVGRQKIQQEAQKTGLAVMKARHETETAKGGRRRAEVVSKEQFEFEAADIEMETATKEGRNFDDMTNRLIKKYQDADKRTWKKLNRPNEWNRTMNALSILKQDPRYGPDHQKVQLLESLLRKSPIKYRRKQRWGTVFVEGFGEFDVPPPGSGMKLPNGEFLSSREMWDMATKRNRDGKVGLQVLMEAQQSPDATIAQENTMKVQMLRIGGQNMTDGQYRVDMEARQLVARAMDPKTLKEGGKPLDALATAHAEQTQKELEGLWRNPDTTPEQIAQFKASRKALYDRALAVFDNPDGQFLAFKVQRDLAIANQLAEDSDLGVFNKDQHAALTKRIGAVALRKYRIGTGTDIGGGVLGVKQQSANIAQARQETLRELGLEGHRIDLIKIGNDKDYKAELIRLGGDKNAIDKAFKEGTLGIKQAQHNHVVRADLMDKKIQIAQTKIKGWAVQSEKVQGWAVRNGAGYVGLDGVPGPGVFPAGVVTKVKEITGVARLLKDTIIADGKGLQFAFGDQRTEIVERLEANRDIFNSYVKAFLTDQIKLIQDPDARQAMKDTIENMPNPIKESGLDRLDALIDQELGIAPAAPVAQPTPGVAAAPGAAPSEDEVAPTSPEWDARNVPVTDIKVAQKRRAFLMGRIDQYLKEASATADPGGKSDALSRAQDGIGVARNILRLFPGQIEAMGLDNIEKTIQALTGQRPPTGGQ